MAKEHRVSVEMVNEWCLQFAEGGFRVQREGASEEVNRRLTEENLWSQLMRLLQCSRDFEPRGGRGLQVVRLDVEGGSTGIHESKIWKVRPGDVGAGTVMVGPPVGSSEASAAVSVKRRGRGGRPRKNLTPEGATAKLTEERRA